MKKLFVILLVCVVLSGCATTMTMQERASRDISFVSYKDAKYEAKPDTATAELFFDNSKPTKPYDVIGEISGQIETADNIKPMLEARAKQVGGDGVIEIVIQATKHTEGGGGFYTYGGFTYGGNGEYTTHEVRAKVIRYK